MNYTSTSIAQKLTELRQLNSENEIVEFKEAKNQYDFKKLGKYFSALSNEANLQRAECAWLVFGVENSKHEIVGTAFRENVKKLHHLKKEIADKTSERISFIEIHECNTVKGRVVLFQIPPAPRGIPIAFEGHYYARDNESLVPLNISELERIRAQVNTTDWSAQVIPDATLDDLDPLAITTARENYKSKFLSKAEQVDSWDTITFLNKAKLSIKGKLTRTAIILLGKEEADHFLLPSVAKIRWVLKDAYGDEKDYALFGLPLLLAVDKVYHKIRNLKYRYIKEGQGTLFPDEVDKYDPYTIREALNNCIAHQDYEKNGRINIIEKENELVFTNLGGFIPRSVEQVVMDDAPEEFYRNRFLANAMFNLKMVDTAGGGIRRMFNHQRKKYFPLPDYDLSNEKVKVAIVGEVLDMKYASLLARHGDLGLSDIILLDKVQKKKPLTKDEIKHLRKQNLIEGRSPNFFIGKKVAQSTGQKAVYSKNRAFDKKYYLDLIIKAINEHGMIERSDADELLWNKLPSNLTEDQKKNKIGNLLAELRRKNFIVNKGTLKESKWHLREE